MLLTQAYHSCAQLRVHGRRQNSQLSIFRRGRRVHALEQEPQKKTVEELVAGQVSGTDPGGELGRQDAGARGGGGDAAAGSRELDVDAELRSALRPLLATTRGQLEKHMGRGKVTPDAVAAAAIMAAEASGALPPMTGPQRAALEGFFARLAEDLGPTAKGGGYESFGNSGGEEGNSPEDAALRVRPHTRELLEEVVNWHLGTGGAPRRRTGPSDSVKAGGEVGNIALQSDTHHCAEVRGVPAESEADRAELQAEAQFEQLELGDLPRATAQDYEELKESQGRPASRFAHAPIEGDAPAAGDGLQAVASEAEARQLSGRNELSTGPDQRK